MESIHYIGLDVHKKIIAFCIKSATGKILRQGTVAAERKALQQWLSDLPQPWIGAMEATIFTGEPKGDVVELLTSCSPILTIDSGGRPIRRPSLAFGGRC